MRGKLLIPPDVHAAGRDFIGIVRAGREFCRRLLFWCWIARFGHSPLAGVAGMLCRRTARLQVRCAPVGDVGAVSRALWLAAEAASLRGCAVRLRPHGRLSFPFEQQRLARIKRAYNLRPNAETSVANAAVMGVARWVQGVRRSLRYRGAEVILGLKGVRA